MNIVRYAAFNLSQFAERSAVRGSDFAGKVESFSEHLLLLRFRSVLSRMKSNIPGRIEASVSKGRPFVAMTTSHTLLKERMFFLEKLEHALGVTHCKDVASAHSPKRASGGFVDT